MVIVLGDGVDMVFVVYINWGFCCNFVFDLFEKEFFKIGLL